jgi:hypothetical protein
VSQLKIVAAITMKTQYTNKHNLKFAGLLQNNTLLLLNQSAKSPLLLLKYLALLLCRHHFDGMFENVDDW